MTGPKKAGSSRESSSGFSALYDATAADLLKYLLRRTPTPEDAADCLAETFLVVWDKRDRLPHELDQARPWLFGVARNILRRDWKRDSRASTAKAELARELHGTQRQIPADDSTGAALQQLSPIDREIIEMLAWDQLAPREVAAILELSPNVVRIRAHRARLKLREELKATKLRPARERLN
jgi:RNA polymerase sigma-70 factor (ECF subfamily)